MGKTRFFAIVMAIVMLASMLTSCKSGTIGRNVVKEDDPWYDTVRFKLERDLKPTDEILRRHPPPQNDNVGEGLVPTPIREF